MDYKILWTIIFVIFLIAEIFTASFGFICFSIGAVVAFLLDVFKLNAGYQIGAFLIVSFVSFVLLRKIARKLDETSPQNVGANKYLNQKGVVIEDVTEDKGLIKVMGEEWRAITENGETVKKGSKVIVKGINGTKLIVKGLKSE